MKNEERMRKSEGEPYKVSVTEGCKRGSFETQFR